MLKYLFSLLALCVVCAGQQAAQAQTHHEQHLHCGTCQHITANRQATVLSPTSQLERGIASKRIVRKKTAAKRPTIDLLFVYDRTGELEALKMGSLEAHAQKATQLSNTVLHNSNIEADFRLVGTMLLGEEIASITKGLDRGIYKADIDARRRATKADIVVICSEPFHDGLAGIAIPEAPDGELAVASVRASAAVGGFTVVHEIGHIFGCQHSRESADPGNHAYAVGASRAPYYTVMGFAEQDGLTEQVPLFSGPQSVWNNVVMGSERENCVRKIRERIDVVSNFDQAEGYILDQTHWNIDSNPQSKEFKLTTTTYYFIDVDVPWLTTTPTRGYNNTTITVTARANPDNNTRVGTITIGAREGGAFPPVTITVTQRGMGEDEPPITPPTDTPQPNPGTPPGKDKENPKQPEPAPLPTYKLDIEGWDIEEQARSTKAKLTTTGEYTLETSASWLTTDIKEGKGDVEFTLSASENKSTTARTATLTIRDKQHKDIAPIVVKVIQKGAPQKYDPQPGKDKENPKQPEPAPLPTYKLDIEGWDIEEQARSTKAKLTTTGEYTLETSASWLTTDIKEGKGDVEFTLSASENKSTTARTATLTIRDKQHKNIAPIVVKVVQKGAPQKYDPQPGKDKENPKQPEPAPLPTYKLDIEGWDIEEQARSTKAKLTTTGEYTLETSASWLTTDIKEGKGDVEFTLSASENKSTTARTATLTIRDKQHKDIAPIVVKVVQKGAPQKYDPQPGKDKENPKQPEPAPLPTYKLDIEGWDIEEQARSTKAKLTTTGEYTLETSASWLTTDIKEGKGDVEFTLSASENKSTTARTATLTIRDKQHKDIAPIVVKVNQEGRPTALLTTGNAKPLAQLRGQVLHLQLPTAMRLSLHDAQGRLLLHKQFEAGQHSLSLPHRGLFLLRWQQPFGTQTQRLLIP